jgi:phospholipid/cholesterol/gamma-HCH transport system substrate-binding protein
MARRLAWSNVRGGLVAIAAIVGICVATLKYARVGALHGDRFRVYAVFGAARGALKGSEVWLMGQRIGKITDIRFRSPAESDTSTRVLVEMEVLEKYRDAMHRDAEAQIRPGGSLIGAMVVYLTAGSAAAPTIRDGDTVHAEAQADAESATAQFGAAARELPRIAGNVKTIRVELDSTSGTVGALIQSARGDGGGALQSASEQLARLRRRMSNERGSLGRIMDGGLGVRARVVMARADSVRTLIASSSGSFGRFRRDSTLIAEVADIRDELATVRASLADSRGTAGRVLHDSAAFSALGEAHREMTLLMADLKKHPLRYNPF